MGRVPQSGEGSGCVENDMSYHDIIFGLCRKGSSGSQLQTGSSGGGNDGWESTGQRGCQEVSTPCHCWAAECSAEGGAEVYLATQ